MWVNYTHDRNDSVTNATTGPGDPAARRASCAVNLVTYTVARHTNRNGRTMFITASYS